MYKNEHYGDMLYFYSVVGTCALRAVGYLHFNCILKIRLHMPFFIGIDRSQKNTSKDRDVAIQMLYICIISTFKYINNVNVLTWEL